MTARSKVLVVGMDGLRFDQLAGSGASVLHDLMACGSYGTSLLPYGEADGQADGGPVSSMAYTDSGPSWSTVVTGVWPDKHGVTGNDFAAADYERYPDFLTRAKVVRPALSAAAFFSWGHLARHGTFSSRIDLRVFVDGDRDGYSGCDRVIVESAERCLADLDPDVLFVYFGGTDEAAHEAGPLGADYRAALLRQDDYLGRLLAAIRSRKDYADERWTVLVTTDHGHLDEGGHGGDSHPEREVFVILAELGRHTGRLLDTPRLVDIAPTVLAQLGIAVDPEWGLDGVALQP